MNCVNWEHFSSLCNPQAPALNPRAVVSFLFYGDSVALTSGIMRDLYPFLLLCRFAFRNHA